MPDLKKIKEAVLAEGVIDADKVSQIKEIADTGGKIDADIVQFLFELNDAVTDEENDPGWKDLMVSAVTKYLIEDGKSPGFIDKEETAWLFEKICEDNKIDDIEKAILLNLKQHAKEMPESVDLLIQKMIM